MPTLLGIDVGTTNTKVRIYSENGDIFGEKIFTTPFYTDRHSGFYDPEEIFHKLLEAISHFNQPLKKEIVALSVSSFAETMVGLNKKGRAITRSIAWFDICTEVQFKELQNHLNTEEIYSTTGLIPYYIYSFYKLLWHRTNSREVFDQVTHWTSISGYILFALSGELSFDYSLASRTMFFNQQKECWWDKMIELIGIQKENIAGVMPSGIALGKIKKEVSQITGLRPDVLVVTGGHDHLCAALATGVFEKGRVLISTGTTESLTVSLEGIPKATAHSLKRPFWWGHHTASNQFYALNGIYSGGYSVDWILKIINESYHSFEKCSLPMKKSIPLFFPYLRGADYNEARGAFLNLDGEMDEESILQGLIAGLCFELRFVWEEMVNVFTLSVKEVTNAGGGSKNNFWMEMKATILNHDIIVPKDIEGSSKGAALIAGIGCGIYSDVDTAYKMTFKIDHVYKPKTRLIEKLDGWYHVYESLLEDIKGINVKIQHNLDY
jgi:sugar (pentulose or hexulose) kinase